MAEPPEGLDFPVERVDSDAGPLLLPCVDEVMLPYLRIRRTWEADEGRLLRRLLAPGAAMLDVGANVGYFSLLASSWFPDMTIDACEPHPMTLRVLRMNVWNAKAPVRVWPVALGDNARIVSLATSPTNLGDTRALSSIDTGVRSDVIAASVRGDELFEGRTFDVIKIDVQGGEAAVISGLAETIARSRSVKIIAEFWPTALRDADTDPLEVLQSYRTMGLDIRVLLMGRLREIDLPDIISVCESSGPDGQVNLLMTHG